MAMEPSEVPLNPVEALKHIRTIIEATAERVYGTPAEATICEIRNILDRALPPRPRRGAYRQQ